MAEQQTENNGPGVGAWIGFWVSMGVLIALAVIGAFFAGKGTGPGDYECGLTLAVCALALAFLRIKYRFDSEGLRSQNFVFVDRMPNLAIVVPLFVLIAIGGLFVAADWPEGSLHNAGIALFGASGLAVLLSLKRVFDTLDSHR